MKNTPLIEQLLNETTPQEMAAIDRQMNQQPQVDAYCKDCDAYICDERVTFEECCDTCGTPIEYHKLINGGNK